MVMRGFVNTSINDVDALLQLGTPILVESVVPYNSFRSLQVDKRVRRVSSSESMGVEVVVLDQNLGDEAY